MTTIQRAVQAAGGQKSLAEKVGVSPQAVNQWVRGKRPVPGRYCIPIEEASAGAVTRYELRPEIFGTPEAPTPKKGRAA